MRGSLRRMFRPGLGALLAGLAVIALGRSGNSMAAADQGCPEVIEKVVANSRLTSSRFYYLSQLEPYIGRDYRNLPCFLQAVGGTALSNATLVIDRDITLAEPLVLPARFTLAGTGIEGEGKLRFIGLPRGVSAIQFAPGASHSTIRDLSVSGPGAGGHIGIDVSGASIIFIRDVRINGFYAGIYGARPGLSALSIYIERCNIHNNDYNVLMHRDAFHWRIRDCILNQATAWGVRVYGPDDDPAPPTPGQNLGSGNDHLIAGSRIEGCGEGGIMLGSHAAMLMNNRFEQNGGVGGTGILILPTAGSTRLMSNMLYSNNLVDDSAAQDTESWGTITGG
ncbi:MAG TPA: right-handed parallel beta-helix repeat-containing protein [Blastocatellia bacterium]|nr:right-handed parallel beta-helix repeat-containing protein [Blastocatellia bacterium]